MRELEVLEKENTYLKKENMYFKQVIVFTIVVSIIMDFILLINFILLG